MPFLVVEQEMSNGAIKASARFFSSFRVRVVFVFMQVAGGVSGTVFIFYLPAYSPRYAPLYLEQEVDHLLLQQLAVLGIHLLSFFSLISMVCLCCHCAQALWRSRYRCVFPVRRGTAENPTFCFTLQESTKNRSAHKSSFYRLTR